MVARNLVLAALTTFLGLSTNLWSSSAHASWDLDSTAPVAELPAGTRLIVNRNITLPASQGLLDLPVSTWPQLAQDEIAPRPGDEGGALECAVVYKTDSAGNQFEALSKASHPMVLSKGTQYIVSKARRDLYETTGEYFVSQVVVSLGNAPFDVECHDWFKQAKPGLPTSKFLGESGFARLINK